MPFAHPSSLVQDLFEGPIDVIGDVHGEIHALEELLRRLGYPTRGPHPEGRRLVYVGDLIDRGPDSPAVLERVMEQVSEGRAQCLLGNHELNLLRTREDRPNRKHGNHWFWNEREPIGPGLPFFGSRGAAPAQQPRFLEFFAQLPLALKRDDLRVVHACWDPPSIESAAQSSDARALYTEADSRTRDAVQASGLAAKSRRLRDQYRDALRDPSARDLPFLAEVAEHHTRLQVENPVKVLSSGLEAPLPHGSTPYHIGGKWRMTVRVPWWQHYRETVPVIFGHYWRRPSPHVGPPDHPNIFGTVPTDAWLGPLRNCFCVDLSVGRRYSERIAGTRSPLSIGCLAALRVPEWELIMDDRPSLQLRPPGGDR